MEKLQQKVASLEEELDKEKQTTESALLAKEKIEMELNSQKGRYDGSVSSWNS